MKETCCICYENEADTRLQCSHNFCKDCVLEVLKRDKDCSLNCPLCRNPTYITSDELINKKIFGIEINRCENGKSCDPEKVVRNYFNNYFGDREYILSLDKDICWTVMNWRCLHIINYRRSSNDQITIYYAIKKSRWSERQCVIPIYDYPSYRMSGYYKLYKTPQIVA